MGHTEALGFRPSEKDYWWAVSLQMNIPYNILQQYTTCWENYLVPATWSLNLTSNAALEPLPNATSNLTPLL